MKRLSADDSADSRVKVGHRQANIPQTPRLETVEGFLLLGVANYLAAFSAHALGI